MQIFLKKTRFLCFLSMLFFVFSAQAMKPKKSEEARLSIKLNNKNEEFSVCEPEESSKKNKKSVVKKTEEEEEEDVELEEEGEVDGKKINKSEVAINIEQVKEEVPTVLNKFLKEKKLPNSLPGNIDIGSVVSVSGLNSGLDMLEKLGANTENSSYLSQTLKKFIKHFKEIVKNSDSMEQKASIFALVLFALEQKITASAPKNYSSFVVKVIGSVIAFVTFLILIFNIVKNYYVPLKDYAFIADAASAMLPVFVFIVGTQLFWDQFCSCCPCCNPFSETRKRKKHALFEAAKSEWIAFGNEIDMKKDAFNLEKLVNKNDTNKKKK